MIGVFWNIRGLGEHGKLQCLRDFINNNLEDFVGFFETKREVIDQHIIFLMFVGELPNSLIRKRYYK